MRAYLLAVLLAVPGFALAQVKSLGVHEVQIAKVIQITPIKIDRRSSTYVGADIGSQVGYTIGDSLGGGRYGLSQLASQIGRTFGSSAEERMHSRGVEILVQDTQGRVFSVIQHGQVEVRAGDTVALVGYGQETRVVPVRP